MKRMVSMLVLFSIAWFCCPAFAGEPPPAPLKCVVGLYLNEILDLNFQEDFIVVDFWLWFRWEVSGDAGSDVGDYSRIDNMEIIDGKITDQIGYRRMQTGNAIYESARIIAKITNRFKMRSYPLDSHVIRIRIEDQEKGRNELEFVADTADSGVSPNVELPGWNITPLEPVIFLHTYRTGFGQTGQARGDDMEYSQFRFSLRLSKSLLISVFKTLWATFIAAFAALLALFLNPLYTARLSLGVGALFTAVAAKISLASSVQSVSQFGFTDAVQVVSGFVILSSIAISVRAYRRIERGEDYESVVRRSDLRWAVVLFGSYVAVVLILILVHALLR